MMLFLALLVFVTVNTLSHGEQSCPEVKVIGVGDSDKLTVLRGCPGHPGFPGQKGEIGAQGEKGQKGSVGGSGKAGPPGVQGKTGSNGENGRPGPPGVKGEKGEKGESVKTDSYAARNCKALQNYGEVLSGWYTIYPDGSQPMKVLCDMDTDGWIVFQRRWDGSVDFFRDWAAYKRGFGSYMNEFWLGNDKLHKLTSTGTWEVRIDLQDFENKKYFAKYSKFKILDESEKYQLELGDFKEGDAGDSFSANTMKFSTKDQDNDVYEGSCAEAYKGAWWYGNCHASNLNGLYHQGNHDTFADGINWHNAKGYNYSFKHVEMKIREILVG